MVSISSTNKIIKFRYRLSFSILSITFLSTILFTYAIFSISNTKNPINNAFAEQINSQEKTMLEKVRAMYYSNNNEKLNSNYINNQNKNNFNSKNYNTEIFAISPTQDKKQFCETGQFKGFYVSSAEFCNLVIPSGPAGPQGIQGETGPIGPAGPNQIPSTKIYSNPAGTVLTSPPNSPLGIATVGVNCNLGDTAISGQPIVSPSSSGVPPPGGSYMSGLVSFSSGGNTGWVFQTFGNNLVLTGRVICFDN